MNWSLDARFWHMYNSVYTSLDNQDWLDANYFVLLASDNPKPARNMLAKLGQDYATNFDITEIDGGDQFPPTFDGAYDLVWLDMCIQYHESILSDALYLYRTICPGGLAIISCPFMMPELTRHVERSRLALNGYEVVFQDYMWRTVLKDFWGNPRLVVFGAEHSSIDSWRNGYDVPTIVSEYPAYLANDKNMHFPIITWWIGQRQ